MSSRRSGIDRTAYLALIRGERRGLLPSLARGGLHAASWAFGAGARFRSGLYGKGLVATIRAPLPVISVGNLTTGGTGKTPLVLALAERLVSSGEKVAVLARGYGAERGELNDELTLIRARLSGVMVYAGADRAASAERASREGASVALLDDGFQHRRLERDVDILVIDSTDPFGTGSASREACYLLPRGLLREPLSAARRASTVVLSRVEQASEAQVLSLQDLLKEEGVSAPVAHMRLEATSLRALAGPSLSLEDLRGKRVVLLSGIGNPKAFERTVADLGAVVARSIARPDHHAFTAEDLAAAERAAAETSADAVVVTEKDGVKLAPLAASAFAGTTSAGGKVAIHELSVRARLENADALLSRIDAVVEAARLSRRGSSGKDSASPGSKKTLARPRACREASLLPGGAP